MVLISNSQGPTQEKPAARRLGLTQNEELELEPRSRSLTAPNNKRSFLPETFRPPIQESQDCERQINGLCAGASFGHYTGNCINILDNRAAIDQPMHPQLNYWKHTMWRSVVESKVGEIPHPSATFRTFRRSRTELQAWSEEKAHYGFRQ